MVNGFNSTATRREQDAFWHDFSVKNCFLTCVKLYLILQLLL